MQQNNVVSFCPANRQEWRNWLMENHSSNQSVWLISYKKKTAIPSITWSDAVDEALCFGWIDGIRKPVDEESYMQFLCKRKPNSGWSKINKAKVERLIAEGLMTKAGYQSIETAKQNGSWVIFDDVEELTIPNDLDEQFKALPGAMDYFLSLSRSVRKSMLQWLVLAKLPETRQKRIVEIAEHAAQKRKPKQF